MATKVFPSTSNIGGGKPLSESNLRTTGLINYNWATFGLDLAKQVDETVTIGAGEAMIGGRRIELDGANPPSFSVAALGGANVTKFIHIKVTLDGSGNVASVTFTAESTCNWAATSTVHWLCLGRVKTGTTTISEVINAVHFPPHGRGLVGRAVGVNEATVNNPATNTYYKVTDLGLPKFMAPRPCLMECSGAIPVYSDGASGSGIYVGLSHDDTPSTTIFRQVHTIHGDGWYPFTLGYTHELAAGDVFQPRVVMMTNTSAGSTLKAASGSYRSLTAWLTDKAGL